jgi:NAD(P)-dependent dehydrogenase (short-subunit alcohol dehydrogenase family)
MTAKITLPGATALVTGGGRGIGRATALALAGEGAHVVVTDLDGDAAEKVAAEAQEAGGTAEGRGLDVTDADAVAALATLLNTRGATPSVGGAGSEGPSVVVANAGVGMTGRLADMTLDDWRWIRSVNLDGVVHTAHAFGPPMLQRGKGHLVITSSGLGYTPRATEPAYCTTKAAVLELAQCLRADWAPHGVGVSAICPGIVDTGILDSTRFLGDATDERRARKTFARGHSPDSVARDVLKAIDDDRALVASGWEAKVGWALHRLAPLRLQQRIASQELR